MTNAHSFMAGGGEMGARIRALDWSNTPLGPVDAWPQSLRSALSILLPSKAQIALCWGERFITLYNDAYLPVFGAKHPQALGKPISEAWDELWRAGLKELFEGVVLTGEAFWAKDLPFFMERHGYLEETYFDVSYDPVRDESGRVGGLFCIVSETTGRVLGERRLRTLRELAKAVQGVRTVDAVHRAAAAALAESSQDIPFALLYGASRNDGAGRLMASAGLAESDPGAAGRLSMARGFSWPRGQELLVVAPEADDPVRAGPWTEPLREVAIVPLASRPADTPQGYLVAGINPRRSVDEDYRDFLRLVASSIGAAVASARESEDEHRRAESLAELDRAKTAFFTNISHEFRTPLTLMLGPIEEALKSGSLDGEELSLAYRNGRRLLRLVNGLLDFARIQAGRLKANFVAVDLPRLTEDLVSLFRSAAERAGLELTIAADPIGVSVQVDLDMYEKIVANLLSNAIKFTPAGTISVALRDRGEAVELAVADTGIGVDAAELPRLFERFHRIEDAWSRTQEGSGIGLALLRDLVALHGGSVDARSSPGQGTTVTVVLPKVPPDAHRAGGASPPVDRRLGGHGVALADEASGWSGGEAATATLPLQSAFGDLEVAGACAESLLVVDDNADIRDYLARLLGRRWRVRTVTDGAEALEAVAEALPDLIVSDVMMPRIDGFGLITALRSLPSTRSIPVMLVSARAGEEARIEALRAGADDYVVKPFSARELTARVESQLLKARLRAVEQEQVRRLAEVFEQAPVGIAVLRGPQHRFEFANDAYLELIDRRRVVGMPIREALPELAGQGIFELLDRVYGGGEPVQARSLRLLVDDAEGMRRERFFDFVYQPMLGLDRRPTGIAVVVHDVSALTEARREADRANRAKDEFLAMLGHELRNPLAPIVTILHVMRMAASPAFARERSILERQVDHLVRLVDDLLDVSRIASGKVELRKTRFDLRDAVAAGLETASPELERGRHHVHTEVGDKPLWVYGDAARLAQVVSNLIVNAAKYTPAGGNIRVLGECSVDRVVLRVVDDGIGISSEMLPQVFDLFRQERQAADRARGGLGLGLAIVKSLVGAHGGDVSVNSAGAGCGSEFMIELPAAGEKQPEEKMPLAGPVAAPGGRSRVLVVDDNADAAQALADALQLHGFETRVALDGPRALDVAESFQPEIGVLDMGLPVMDGLELGQRLMARHEGIRLIAVSGYGAVPAGDSRNEAAFEARLLKPVELRALLELLGAAPAAKASDAASAVGS